MINVTATILLTLYDRSSRMEGWASSNFVGAAGLAREGLVSRISTLPISSLPITG